MDDAWHCRMQSFAIVLECIPYHVARLITEELTIPTIGIGAGPYVDGLVLVLHDIIDCSNGLYQN